MMARRGSMSFDTRFTVGYRNCSMGRYVRDCTHQANFLLFKYTWKRYFRLRRCKGRRSYHPGKTCMFGRKERNYDDKAFL